MRIYSPFFQTLYDQTEPVGSLGRGTHYSVLRAIVFHDQHGEPLKQDRYRPVQAQHHDFVILWDEDHDERIVDVLHKIYAVGILPMFTFLGERKGGLTALARADSEVLRHFAARQVEELCDDINGDYWNSEVGTHMQPGAIINDKEERVRLFLENIDMLWKLGSKPIPRITTATA